MSLFEEVIAENFPDLGKEDKCSGLVHWEDPEGSGGEGAGRGYQEGKYM